MQLSWDNSTWLAWEAYAETKSVTVPAGAGIKTLYVRFKDLADNISTVANDSIFYTPGSSCTLTLTIIGKGVVNGTVNGLSGLYCDSGPCSTDYVSGTQISLMASPDGLTIFSGWGGDCAGKGNCTLTMDASKSVSSVFITLPSVRIGGGTPVYLEPPTLQNTYLTSANNSIIEMKSGALGATDTLTANDVSGKTVTLKGGFDASYALNSGGSTTITGPLKISRGKVLVEKVKVQ